MPEKVTIAYRGAKYEIGRGRRFYGIWVTDEPTPDPIDRWPENSDGWIQAWTRFTAIETPGTIRQVPKHRRGPDAGTMAVVAAGLLGLGVLLGVIGLFPRYVGLQSVASASGDLVPHLIYLLTWAASGALIAIGGWRSAKPGLARLGALLGTGLSAVTFGLFFTDLGQVISGGSSLLGAGLVLSILGWFACATGSLLAFTIRPRTPAAPIRLGRPTRPRFADAGPVALVLLAAIGAVATFAPAWDSYTLPPSVTGAAQPVTVTLGDAFANPGVVIAGNVAVMVAVVAMAVLAALWRPVRHGAVLLASTTIPLAAQAISALIEVRQPVPPSLFNVSPSAGVTITSGVTPIFWVYCVFVISLAVSCAWMLTAPRYPAMPGVPQSPVPGPVPPPQAVPQAVPQGVDDEDGDSDDDDSGDDDSDDDAEDDAESTYA